MHNTTIYNNTNQTTITCNNTAQILQNKKVGVVIPIYNVAQYLRECLDSVINQTYKNLSVLLVNDGSTDNNESLNIAKEYVAKDSRFILIDKENGGQSTARNVGIAWFSEKYETTLDSS
uniref:glycosyltransferase family 2 protein n=1 Tax=Helicobacter trogontum TaxID=50960 RepID=UPI001319BF22